MKSQKHKVHVLLLALVIIISISGTKEAKTEDDWLLVQNGSQGYAVHCPTSAIVRRYDPEGVLQIELLDHQTLTVRVRPNLAHLSATEWTDTWLSNKQLEDANDVRSPLPILARSHISIGNTIAEVVTRPGLQAVNRRIVIANDEQIYLINHPIGHAYNESVFNRIVSTFEANQNTHDSGFQIVETDSTQTISSLLVPSYSQTDPRWICDQLGTCNCDYNACTTQSYTTIGDGGCHITSQAMIFDYYAGHFMDPQELDTCLTNNGKYGQAVGFCVNGNCGIDHATSPCIPSVVTFQGISWDKAILDADLSNGFPVVGRNSDDSHSVVVIGKSGGNYQIIDSWDGLQKQVSPSWISYFWRYHGPLPEWCPDPVDTLGSGWTIWSPRNNGGFALDQCKPLRIGDVNGDGRDDLVCPYDYSNSSTTTFVQLSSGSAFGGWTAWGPHNGSFALDQCRSLQIGDVNGDRRDDLVCPYDYGNSSTTTFVQLSSGSAFGGWTAWGPHSDTFALDQCKSLQIGDTNGDGRDDLVCPYDYGNSSTTTFVQLSSGSAFGGWTAWGPHSDAFALDQCKPLRIGDVNGDRRDDLICPYSYGNCNTTTFLQYSSGSAFSDWSIWRPRHDDFGMKQCKSLRVGDINGDRCDDLVCPYDYGSSTTTTWVQITSQFSVYLPLVLK